MDHWDSSKSSLSEHTLTRQMDGIRERLCSALFLVDDTSNAIATTQLSRQTVAEVDVEAIIKERRARDRFFEADLFADPAWDILLTLYAAELGQRRMSVSDVTNAAAVPTTTALRWIAQLEKKSLIQRRPDPMDARRFFLSLTSNCLQSMADYFRTVPVRARAF